MQTSRHLTEGNVYTRKDLAEQFGITDATINTGIFQPAGHQSVWLFITEKKTADRTQYTDLLTGDVLYWDGQTEGRKDLLIIEHEQRGLELLVFYRVKRNQFAGGGFRYEGRFRHESHRGSRPTHFTLRHRSS
jgi:5-methylcytosine-specific restriction enzyme A